MNNYAASDEIFVFPISVARPNGPDGRMLTEHNISTYIEKLTNRSNYVIHHQVGANPYIQFMIEGHYFELSDSAILDMKPLYANIKISESAGTLQNITDDLNQSTPPNHEFKGVVFSNSPQEGYISLALTDEQGNVPIESYFRFDRNVVKNIYGGTV